MTDNSYEEFVPKCGRCLMLWSSRYIVRAALNQNEIPELVLRAFENPVHKRLFESVRRVWEILIQTTTETYVVHEPNCFYLSVHEHLVMTELDCLQNPIHNEFGASLAAVLPQSSLRLIGPEMQSLAKFVYLIDQANQFRAENNQQQELLFSRSVQGNSRIH